MTRFLSPAALLLALLLPVSACGGGDGESTSSDGTTPGDTAGVSLDTAAAEHATTEPHAEGESSAQQEHGSTGSDSAPTVHLAPDQRKGLGIRVARLDTGQATSTVSRPATVTFNLDRVARVGPRLSAKVVRVTGDLGERVEEGEPVAVMSSVELGKAKASYLSSRAHLETARAAYERQKTLRDKDISSEADLFKARARFREARAEYQSDREALRLYGLTRSEIESIEAGSEEPLSYFRLTSPVDGVIQQRDLAPGQTVGPSETPVHVARIDQLWVMIDAFERDVPLLEGGQGVELTVRSLPDQTFTGETDWVSYELDPQTRTIRVRAVVENETGDLRAGMFGTASVETNRTVRYATVPVDAVQSLHGAERVFVPGEEPGSFRAVPVRLGEEADGRVEIVSGLTPGDSAVVAGSFELKSALTASGRSASHGH